MSATATYARLRSTDPARWRSAALAWRAWAALAGEWASQFGPLDRRLREAWSGAAAAAAIIRFGVLRRVLDLFRVLCWEADQALSEFAAGLERARALLARAVAAAKGSGSTIDDSGTVRDTASTGAAGDLAAALTAAADADGTTAARLGEVGTQFGEAAAAGIGAGAPPPATLPPCAATPAEVRAWWETLTPQQRRWLVVTGAGWVGSLDGVPAAYRDLANRLLLETQESALDAAVTMARGADGRRLDGLRHGLAELAGRLAAEDGPRAYLLRLDVRGDGRAVVALGDPDSAAHILTHVPGMTADLKSFGGELTRAERVAVHAAAVGPDTATSAVLWLDYDAPDFLDQAAGTSPAEAGATGLRRFQEGLRATHTGAPGQQTVLGHSYGSLLVGRAAAPGGLAADDVVFVGSPGVGVDSAAGLHMSAGHVWSSTSRTDVIQYLAVAPASLPHDLLASAIVPLVGPARAFGTPESHLWFGHNPSDPVFGARTFAGDAGGGHLGYWDPGSRALDTITAITLGRAR